jgi:DNA-binding transcriptional LysR family regulator
MEYSTDKTLLREIPVQLPCPLTGTHPAPNQPLIALELECTNGPLVQIVETTSGRAWNPVTGMDSHFLAWDFDGNIHLRVDALGNTRVVRVEGNLQTNSSEVIRAAVLAGVGISNAPTWMLDQELAAGEVQRLLPDWEPAPMPIHLVSPPERRHSAKVKAFAEHVAGAIRCG